MFQLSTDGGVRFTDLAGATGPLLSFAAAARDNGNQYRAVFTNTGDATLTATSNAATLTVRTKYLSSSQVKILYPLFLRPSKGKVQATFAIANTSGKTIQGPTQVVFPNLPPGATVVSSQTLSSLKPGKVGWITVTFNHSLNTYLGLFLRRQYPAFVQAG
jgi:archaellum component FlaG (FlaF/FlaG flagellin family)